MKDLLEKMSLEEFRQKILLPILKDNKACEFSRHK